MSWTYRVFKHINEDNGFTWFDIREIYKEFPDSERLAWTERSKSPLGKTVDELRADLKMMLVAVDLPVLEEKGETLVEAEQ